MLGIGSSTLARTLLTCGRISTDAADGALVAAVVVGTVAVAGAMEGALVAAVGTVDVAGPIVETTVVTDRTGPVTS
jgi:hypothetical protein